MPLKLQKQQRVLKVFDYDEEEVREAEQAALTPRPSTLSADTFDDDSSYRSAQSQSLASLKRMQAKLDVVRGFAYSSLAKIVPTPAHSQVANAAVADLVTDDEDAIDLNAILGNGIRKVPHAGVEEYDEEREAETA